MLKTGRCWSTACPPTATYPPGGARPYRPLRPTLHNSVLPPPLHPYPRPGYFCLTNFPTSADIYPEMAKRGDIARPIYTEPICERPPWLLSFLPPLRSQRSSSSMSKPSIPWRTRESFQGQKLAASGDFWKQTSPRGSACGHSTLTRVHNGAETNELWIDVDQSGNSKTGSTSVRINRELLWRGHLDTPAGQIGLLVESFGAAAVVDFQRLQLFHQ